MPMTIRGFKVFIASPRGLEVERKRFREAITEYNEIDGLDREVSYIPVGWEDTLSQVGRPQKTINLDVEKCDYFVLVLWDRWGQPPKDGTGSYSSGTEEEYYVASKCFSDDGKPMRQLVVLFKGVEERQLSDPGEQLQKVIAFRRKIEADKNLLYKTFDTPEEFAKIIRKHLAQWTRDHEEEKKKQPPLPAPPDEVLDRKEFPLFKEYETVDQLLKDAEDLAAKRRMVDAEALFAKAVVVTRSVDARLKYGKFLRHISRLSHAITILESAVDLAKETGDQLALAECKANLGIIARHQHKLNEAETLLRQALESLDAASFDNVSLRAYILGNTAQLYREMGDFFKAEDLQKMAIGLQEGFEDKSDLANSYGSLGVIFRRQKRYGDAEKAHLHGIALSKEIGEKGKGTLAYNAGSLGLVYESLNRLDDAIRLHTQALEINKEMNREETVAMNLGHLAFAQFKNNKLVEADSFNEQSFEINSRTGNLEGMAYNYSIRGRLSFSRSDFDSAIRNFHNASEFYLRRGNNSGAAHNYEMLGNSQEQKGQLGAAADSLAKAAEFAEKGGDLNHARSIREKVESIRNQKDSSPDPENKVLFSG